MSKKASVVVSWGVIVLCILYILIVPMIVPSTGYADFNIAYQPPSAAHWLGTDSQGHDLFVLLAQALRVSLFIALCASLSAGIFGTIVGMAAGTAGGWWDRVLMRITDMVAALPGLVIGLIVVALFRGSVFAIVGAISMVHWTPVARVVRAELLSVRRSAFIEVDHLANVPTATIWKNHFIERGRGQLIVAIILMIPHGVWFEATLTFLGVGLPPNRPSLGNLFAQAQSSLLMGAWWLLVFPSLVLIALTLSVSVIGHNLPFHSRTEERA